MQVNKALILFFLVLLPLNSFSQETIARFKYEDAEKAFVAQNYQECIDNLDEAEKLLGRTAPNILHLKILAQYKLFEKNLLKTMKPLKRFAATATPISPIMTFLDWRKNIGMCTIFPVNCPLLQPQKNLKNKDCNTTKNLKKHQWKGPLHGTIWSLWKVALS